MSLVDTTKYNGINPTDPPANARTYNASSTTPIDNTTNAQPSPRMKPYIPQPDLKLYVKISPADFEKIRAMVREEVGNALAELKHEMNMQGWKL